MVEDLLDPEEHPQASGHVGSNGVATHDPRPCRSPAGDSGNSESFCDDEPLLADRMMELARVGFLEDMVRL